ncbi:MAG: PIN domain-containing protein, partial [Gammaproteobacteria bacterium]|nr:PIN domain-containing protein [Gammaproteobacteria bacterium]
MVFIDSNVPMYLVGAAHPNKVDAQRRLETLVTQRVRLVTDAEVMTEILHRYTALERRAHRQRGVLQHQLLGALDGLAVDGQHLVHDAEQRIERGLDAAAALERGVAMQDLGHHLGVGDEPHALRDERLEAA